MYWHNNRYKSELFLYNKINVILNKTIIKLDTKKINVKLKKREKNMIVNDYYYSINLFLDSKYNKSISDIMKDENLSFEKALDLIQQGKDNYYDH